MTALKSSPRRHWLKTLLAGVQAMTQVYQQFKDTGSSAKGSTPLYDFADLTKLMGFEDVWAFEKRYAETN